MFSPACGANLSSSPIEVVPCNSSRLNTYNGYFIAELENGPEFTLKSLLALAEEGLKLAIGDYKSSFVDVLLFLLRIVTKCSTFIKDVILENSSSENSTLTKYDFYLADWLERTVVVLKKWLAQSENAGAKTKSTIFRAHIVMTVWPMHKLDTDSGISFTIQYIICKNMACSK